MNQQQSLFDVEETIRNSRSQKASEILTPSTRKILHLLTSQGINKVVTASLLDLAGASHEIVQYIVGPIVTQQNGWQQSIPSWVGNNVMVSEEGRIIQDVFRELGKITWQSFVANCLPLLKLHLDIQTALQKGEIEYTKAKEINRIKNDDERQEVLNKAIAESLSLSEIRILVGNILQQQSESKPSSHNQEQKEKADKIYKALRKSKIWNDEKKLKKINKLFAQIEALLEEENKDDPSLQQGSL